MATVTENEGVDIIPPTINTPSREQQAPPMTKETQKNEKPERLNDNKEPILSLTKVGNISKIVTKQLVYKEYDHSQEKYTKKEKLKNFDKKLFSKHIAPIV